MASSQTSTYDTPHTQALLVALGIRSDGLAAACMLPLALTTLLFAGPLVQLVVGGRPEWQRRTALPPAAALRNWLAAPLVEEFVFRACLISFLLTAGARPAAVVWLSPLLFGAAHLHHAWELCRHKGQARGAAARAVAFQLCYSTVFGWLAALLFVRTRHLAAAVLPHAFCNFMGPPAPPAAEERHARLIAAAYAGGIVAFLALLAPLTRPALFAIDLS